MLKIFSSLVESFYNPMVPCSYLGANIGNLSAIKNPGSKLQKNLQMRNEIEF